MRIADPSWTHPAMMNTWGGVLDLSTKPDRTNSSAGEAPRVVVYVCETCRDGSEASDQPRAGARLADAARSLQAPDVDVRAVACLANCKRGLSAAIQRADGWSYVFGDLSLDSAGDLLDGARLLAASADGLMPWKGRPDALKRGMIARMPPLQSISNKI